MFTIEISCHGGKSYSQRALVGVACSPLAETSAFSDSDVMSACVSVPCPSSFICGSRWSRADEFSQRNILSDTHLSSDNKALPWTLALNFTTIRSKGMKFLGKSFFYFFHLEVEELSISWYKSSYGYSRPGCLTEETWAVTLQFCDLWGKPLY